MCTLLVTNRDHNPRLTIIFTNLQDYESKAFLEFPTTLTQQELSPEDTDLQENTKQDQILAASGPSFKEAMSLSVQNSQTEGEIGHRDFQYLFSCYVFSCFV